MHPFVKEVFDPRAGRIDQTTGLPAEFLAGINIFRLDNPQAVFAFRRNCPGTGPTSPPLRTTICALASTRRASSTQQSEYSKPRTISGFNTDSAPNRKPVEPGKLVRFPGDRT
jgi:hypothetical protein